MSVFVTNGQNAVNNPPPLSLTFDCSSGHKAKQMTWKLWLSREAQQIKYRLGIDMIGGLKQSSVVT